MGIGDSEPGTPNPNLDRGVGRGRFRAANRWRDEPPAAAAEPIAPPPESVHCSSQEEELGPVERHLQELLNENLKKNNGTIDNETIAEILTYVTLQDLSKYSGLCKQVETAEERHADLVPQEEESATLQQEDVHEIEAEQEESAATQDIIGQTAETQSAQTAETEPEPERPNEEVEIPQMTVRERFPGASKKMIIGPGI